MRLLPVVVSSMAIGVVLGAAGAEPATEPGFDATVSPRTVAIPGTKTLTYRLLLRGSDREERFSVALLPPLFVDGSRREGSLLRGPPRIELSGGAAFAGGGFYTSSIPACSPYDNRFHGAERVVVQRNLVLQPHSTATLTAIYRRDRDTPWPDSRYSLTFRVGPVSDPQAGPSTISKHERITSPTPKLGGRTGVHIRLWTRPRSSATAGLVRPRKISRGNTISIFGRTLPRLGGHRLALRYRGPGTHSRLVTIARVRIGQRGRFHYRRWRPRKRGVYELWAFYRSLDRDVVSDYACPRGFRLV